MIVSSASALSCTVARVVALLPDPAPCRAATRHPDDAVHRRADLVAHVGKELALGRAGRLGLHGQPVGAGNRVLEIPIRGLGLLVRSAQGLLCRLPLGHIPGDAAQRHRRTRFAPAHPSPLREPRGRAVLVGHAELDRVGGVGCDGVRGARLDDDEVVGVDVDVERRPRTLDGAGWQAVERGDRLVPVHDVRGDLPLPDAHVGGAQHEVEPLAALAKSRLGRAPLADVTERDDRSRDLAVFDQRPRRVLRRKPEPSLRQSTSSSTNAWRPCV